MDRRGSVAAIGAGVAAAVLAAVAFRPLALGDPVLVGHAGKLRFLSARVAHDVRRLGDEGIGAQRIDLWLMEVAETLEDVEARLAASGLGGVDEAFASVRSSWSSLSARAREAAQLASESRRFHATAAEALRNLAARLRAKDPPGKTTVEGSLCLVASAVAERLGEPGSRREPETLGALAAKLGVDGPEVRSDLAAFEGSAARHRRFDDLQHDVERLADASYRASDELVATVQRAYVARNESVADALQWSTIVLAGLVGFASARYFRGVLQGRALEIKHQTLALESVAEAVVLTDATGTIRYANRAFEKLTGHRVEDVKGRTPAILRSGIHDRSFYDGLWTTIRRGATWSGHIVNRRADGSVFETDQTIAPVTGPKGDLVGFVSVFRDATGEAQAARLRALGTTVAEVAHEVNNPTNVVALGARSLAHALDAVVKKLDGYVAPGQEVAGRTWRELRDELPRTVAEIDAAATRIADFVKDLRGFAAPDALPSTFAVVDAVDAAVRSLRPGLELAGVTLEVEREGLADWRLVGSARRFEQVLVNLLQNALRAVPRGTGRICVSARDTGEGPELSVEDDGPGVPPEIARRIFTPFATTHAESGGLGLGLALCARFVSELGGSIALDPPVEGRGATFRIRLPQVVSTHG